MAAEIERTRLVIVGAGMGGICLGVSLLKAGVSDFVILERSESIGGVWRDNTYPGAACDVPSNLYCFSWDQPSWSRRYSGQTEILGYMRGVIDRHGLAGHIRLSSEVTSMAFRDDTTDWRVELKSGAAVVAQVVVSCVGQLSEPAFPDIAGRELFSGRSWHSAEWPTDDALTDMRVAVIGTGASSIQFVPEIAKVARSVIVFQRSAPYVVPKADTTWSSWQRSLFRVLPAIQRLDRLKTFLRGEMLTLGYVGSARLTKLVTKQWRAYMESEIGDEELRAKCTPSYTVGCKRILFSNEWYKTLKLPNVTLETDQIVAIQETGPLMSDGVGYEVDVLIYGTGFAGQKFVHPVSVTGRSGRSLDEAWAAGVSTYKGMMVHGFPNFFMLYGPNTNLGANSILYMLEAQSDYVVKAIRLLEDEGLAGIEPSEAAQSAFQGWLKRAASRTVYQSGCKSWYTDSGGVNVNNWPTLTFRYGVQLDRLEPLDFDVQPKCDYVAS